MFKKNQHKYRIHKFAFCYLINNACYSALTTMIYVLYTKIGLTSLMLIGGIFEFIGLGFSNLIALYVIRRFNLKKSVILGFIGLLLYNVMVLITVSSV
jgi:hypothetical protein